MYGMAAAGALPASLAGVGTTSIPMRATVSVLAVAGAAVFLGNLTQIATLTDAAVLLSFMLVNVSLPWLTVRGATAGGGGRRAADVVLPAGGVLLCGFLTPAHRLAQPARGRPGGRRRSGGGADPAPRGANIANIMTIR